MPRPTHLLPLLLLGATGCASVSPHVRWVEARFGGMGLSTLCDVVASAVESEGYGLARVDLAAGRVESPWAYGTSQRRVRGPSRRKVVVEIQRAEDGLWHLRLRVREEVIHKRGLLATRVRESDDWEAFGDNLPEARHIMTTLSILLGPDASDRPGAP